MTSLSKHSSFLRTEQRRFKGLQVKLLNVFISCFFISSCVLMNILMFVKLQQRPRRCQLNLLQTGRRENVDIWVVTQRGGNIFMCSVKHEQHGTFR